MTVTSCEMQLTVKVIYILCLACVVHLSTGQDIESQLEDDPMSSSSWPGHLQPLGSASNKLPIVQLDNFPSPSEFFQTYVYPSVPVVFKGGAKRSPAFTKWTDEYIKSLPGAQEPIDVENRKIENRTLGLRSIPFIEFLDRYETHDEYLVTGVPNFLKKDVLVPPPLLCDNITAHFLDVVMWFSSGGTKSVLHNDDVDNINCLFSGQKDILFINYTRYRKQIILDHPEGSYSDVNVEQVNLNEYPELHDVQFWEAKLDAGDCVYIPYKWYHQVNSFNRNIAVNIWWNHMANILPSSHTCGSPNPNLSVADVQFSSMDDEDNDKLHPELVFIDNPGLMLMDIMEDEGILSLTEDQLWGILSAKMSVFHGGIWNEEALELRHEIFQLFDVNGKTNITPDDLKMLPVEDESFSVQLLRNFVMLMDVFDEERRRKILQSLEENRSTGSKDQDKDEL